MLLVALYFHVHLVKYMLLWNEEDAKKVMLILIIQAYKRLPSRQLLMTDEEHNRNFLVCYFI